MVREAVVTSPQAKKLRHVSELHAEVGASAGDLARVHQERLQCGEGCADCCVDDLSVFQVEADLIREHHGELLEDGTPHPAGACAFLDENKSCRIYEHRPYVCRTQGLPLRWFESSDDGSACELRDICYLNEDGGPPVENLPAHQCWTIGPYEGRLAELQGKSDDDPAQRVKLRDLFRLE